MMKISEISTKSIYSYYPKRVQNKPEFCTNNSACSQLSYETYRAYALTKLFTPSFKANKPTPNYKNTKEFAKYFTQKVSDELGVKTEEDINTMISDVCEETNADKKTVTEVIARLSQFASFNDLPQLTGLLRYKKLLSDKNLSLNSIINYLSDSKEILSFRTPPYKNEFAFLLDRFSLDLLEKSSQKDLYDFPFFRDTKYLNDSKQLDFIILDGLACEIDGKNCSNSFINGQSNVKENAITIIKKMQKEGISVNEALNGDAIKRVKDLFGDSARIRIVQSRNLKKTDAKSIAKAMNPIIPTNKEIIRLINTATDFAEDISAEETNEAKKLLAQYLDTKPVIFSPTKMERVLKEKYKQIENTVQQIGKTMDDVVYCVPDTKKSYGETTYQYAQVNNIPLNQIRRAEFYEIGKKSFEELEDKVIVVLDDIAGSGKSMLLQKYNSDNCGHYLKNFNIIYAPVVGVKRGIKNIQTFIDISFRNGKDFVLPSVVFDGEEGINAEAKRVQRDILHSVLGGKGYDASNTCTVFPYGKPDNNNGFGYLLGSLFIPNPLSPAQTSSLDSTCWRYTIPPAEMIKIIKGIPETKIIHRRIDNSKNTNN